MQYIRARPLIMNRMIIRFVARIILGGQAILGAQAIFGISLLRPAAGAEQEDRRPGTNRPRDPGRRPDSDADGNDELPFRSLFNGHDLTGWEGDPRYW